MTNNIYLLKFNNYYNRLIKGFDTIAEYEQYIADSYTSCNFFENDGITTGVVANTAAFDIDYLIVCDEDDNIMSRWFITESVKKCGGQYEISLSRDVVMDYKNIIINAPCFIEKATLSADDPLIFNQEDFTANQIKTKETLLKDRSGCAWLVGYLSNSQSIENITVKKEIEVNTETIGNLANWKYYPFSNKAEIISYYENSIDGDIVFKFWAIHPNNFDKAYEVKIYYYQKQISIKTKSSNVSRERIALRIGGGDSWEDIKTTLHRIGAAIVSTNFNADLRPEIMPAYVGDITNEQGKLIEDNEDKVYLVNIEPRESTTVKEKEAAKNGFIDIAFKSAIGNLADTSNVKFYYTATFNNYFLILDEQEQYNVNFNLDISLYSTNDIYRIVCIPFPAANDYFQINGVMNNAEEEIGTIRMTREAALTIANSIMRAGGGVSGSSLVYDFQLLPYCPVLNSVMWGLYEGRSYIDLQGDLPAARKYTPVGDIGVVFEVLNPRFSFNINESIIVEDVKVENQLDMYRLCSPNFAAAFEFNAAKNGGVSYFSVDCHYKPYQPYIHVNPNFGMLYGQNFGDARGLILAGDFSLSSLNDAFTTYELQNKNYQLMFDRGIQNMEVQNKYARRSEIWQAVTGTVQGASSGAMSGAMAGGAWGAAIGGVVGGASALAGGLADIKYNQALRQEALDYTKDMYGFNLENIKAMPDTLTKVSAINPNNKLYPVLEYYTCTDREKEAFKNKIKYNGMTVGAIDTISNYIQIEPTYIKGKIIRLENLNENYHLARTIADEINKGVFI